MASKPTTNRLRTKVYLGTDDRGTGPHLANRDRPTGPEIALLDTLNADLRDCRKIALTEAPPARVANLAELHTATEKLWIEGAAGRLTWGQFNQRRRTIDTQEQALLTAPAPALATPRKQDLFALDHRSDDPQLRLRGPRQPNPGPSFSITSQNGAASSSGYCDRMANTAYCDPRR